MSEGLLKPPSSWRQGLLGQLREASRMDRIQLTPDMVFQHPHYTSRYLDSGSVPRPSGFVVS